MAGKKSSIARLSGDLFPELVTKLRAPTQDDALGRLVLDTIIPAVASLRSQVRIKFSTMFSLELLEQAGIAGDIDCGNLDESDRFFEGIKER